MRKTTLGPRLEGAEGDALVLGSVIEYINKHGQVLVTYTENKSGGTRIVEPLLAEPSGLKVLTEAGVKVLKWTEVTLQKLSSPNGTMYCQPELVRRALGFEH